MSPRVLVVLTLVLLPSTASPRVEVDDQPAKTQKKHLTRGEIQKGMMGVKQEVQACYERYRKPGLVNVRVTIACSGRVERAEVIGSFAGTPTATCVEEAVSHARFPAFTDGPLHITYPFILR